MADNASVFALRAALQEFENQDSERERLRAERASMQAEDLRGQCARQFAQTLELTILDTWQAVFFRWAAENPPYLAEMIRDAAPLVARARTDVRRGSRFAPY